MSLLMEALRKAEEAKKRAQDQEKKESLAASADSSNESQLQTQDFPPAAVDTEEEATETPASFNFAIVDPPAPLTRESAGYDTDADQSENDAQHETVGDAADHDPGNVATQSGSGTGSSRKSSSTNLEGYFSGPPDLDDAYPPPASDTAGIENELDAGTSDSTAYNSESNLSKYLDEDPDLDDAYPPPSTAHRVGIATEREKLAAASIFAAKRAARPQGTKKTTIVLAIMLALIIPVGGGVFWYLNSGTSSSLVNPALSNFDTSSRTLGDAVAEIPAPAPTAIEDEAQDSGQAIVQGDNTGSGSETGDLIDELSIPENENQTPAAPMALTTNLTSTTENNQSPTVTQNTAIPADATPAVATAAEQPPAATPANNTVAASATAPASSGLVVTRTSSSRRINPQLQNAYAMLQSGNLLMAGQLYEEVLAETPNSRDALLGIASVYASQGDTNSSRAVYSRLLQLNPRDPLARTGLLQTVQSSNAAELEGQLRTLQNQFPDVAPLTFALGNFYAGQQRWAEAQEAYFNALLQARRSAGPVSPDYAFNLAVSLEQLGQRATALEYYQQAQVLSQQSKPGFDPALLSQRLSVLQGSAP